LEQPKQRGRDEFGRTKILEIVWRTIDHLVVFEDLNRMNLIVNHSVVVFGELEESITIFSIYRDRDRHRERRDDCWSIQRSCVIELGLSRKQKRKQTRSRRGRGSNGEKKVTLFVHVVWDDKIETLVPARFVVACVDKGAIFGEVCLS